MPVIHQGKREERHSCLENQGVWKVCWSFREEAISVENAWAKTVNKKINLENELGEINILSFLSTTALGNKVQQQQTAGPRPFNWEITEGHHQQKTTKVPGSTFVLASGWHWHEKSALELFLRLRNSCAGIWAPNFLNSLETSQGVLRLRSSLTLELFIFY